MTYFYIFCLREYILTIFILFDPRILCFLVQFVIQWRMSVVVGRWCTSPGHGGSQQGQDSLQWRYEAFCITTLSWRFIHSLCLINYTTKHTYMSFILFTLFTHHLTTLSNIHYSVITLHFTLIATLAYYLIYVTLTSSKNPKNREPTDGNFSIFKKTDEFFQYSRRFTDFFHIKKKS